MGGDGDVSDLRNIAVFISFTRNDVFGHDHRAAGAYVNRPAAGDTRCVSRHNASNG